MKNSGIYSTGLSVGLAAILAGFTFCPLTTGDGRNAQNAALTVPPPSAQPAPVEPMVVVLPPPPALPAKINPLIERQPEVPATESDRDKPTVRPPTAATAKGAKPAPKKPLPTRAPTMTAETLREGRVLLRLMERGEGPAIEIAWPKSSPDRARLYRLLTNCFGMRNAVMNDRQQLFIDGGATGTPWQPNLDQFSGFIRLAAGQISDEERQIVAAIRRRHGDIQGAAVRIFPRRLDALVLGALHRASGETARKSLRATYRLAGNTIIVGQFSADGRIFPGQFDLTHRAVRCSDRR